MTGHANGGKAQWDAYLGKTYHSPQDDLTQKIDWDAGARYALLNYRIARAMADAPQRPMWLQGDYFGDLYDREGPRAPVRTASQTLTWRYSRHRGTAGLQPPTTQETRRQAFRP